MLVPIWEQVPSLRTVSYSGLVGDRLGRQPAGSAGLLDDAPFILHPGAFVLASTYERVRLPRDLAAPLERKSSLGQLGLVTHSTAGFIGPGFEGHVTLELSNLATPADQAVAGYEGRAAGCLPDERPGPVPIGSMERGSRYQGQRGPTPSRSWQGLHQTTLPAH
ncbi:hypothetical protein GCM10020295_64600 [Streptomyces cinereospinus]